jgi:CBS domain containing-hemolysin-like protein
MPFLPVTQQRRPWAVPAFLGGVLRAVGAVAGAMADQALFVILVGVAMAARLLWWVATAAFVSAGVMSLLFWHYGMARDAWSAAYLGALALALMAGMHGVERLYTRYRSKAADF